MDIKTKEKTVLTVNGSDCTGGAGMQADIKTIATLGAYAVSAITSITLQNTLGIQQFYDLPASIISGQIEAIVNDVQPDVMKVGMVRNVEQLFVIAEAIERYQIKEVVYDPVVFSSYGEELMNSNVMREVKSQLLGHCSLVTIKQSDAEYLLGLSSEQKVYEDNLIVERLKQNGCKAVLLRRNDGTDVLYNFLETEQEVCFTGANSLQPSHGALGILSAAIAVNLCKPIDLQTAVAMAHDYVDHLMVYSSELKGRSSELYNDFVNAVATHYKDNSDVHFYANQLNVGGRYLAQVTKRIAGKTPKNIIDEYLMKESLVLLSTTSKTVQEVAYELGFNTQAHFARFFKKMKGCSPTEYRSIKQI